ncbi:MAG: rod shape-determining protein [Clostridia bacterium]|nr:rod shape-determining protein [Clostridia bacterium]
MSSVEDIGIDLGTSSLIIYACGDGIKLREASVVIKEPEAPASRCIRYWGRDAYRMIGRVPSHLVAVRPLREGVVSDIQAAKDLLSYFVQQTVGKHWFKRPNAVISMPSGINEEERRHIAAILYDSGCKRVQPLDRPLAAALGAGIDVRSVSGSMVVDIGAGMTDIAVLSNDHITVSDNPKLGGDQFDEAIIRYLRRKHNFLIGELSAEKLKMDIGSAIPLRETLYADVAGRSLISGLPKSLRVSSDEVFEAMDEPLTDLIEKIRGVLERTPAALGNDIFDKSGITLTGGGAMLYGLSDAIAASLKVKCTVAANPHDCVAMGCAATMENPREFGRYLATNRFRP